MCRVSRSGRTCDLLAGTMQSRYMPALQVIFLYGEVGASDIDIKTMSLSWTLPYIIAIFLYSASTFVNSKQQAAVLSLLPLRIAGFAR